MHARTQTRTIFKEEFKHEPSFLPCAMQQPPIFCRAGLVYGFCLPHFNKMEQQWGKTGEKIPELIEMTKAFLKDWTK